MPLKPYLSSREVTAILDISAATLYSYVSRGLIRSELSPDDSRQRRYLAEDVRRLAERKAARRDPAQAAQGALRWGTPVLDSALTLITENGLYYRGFDALRLAQEATFEEVAALLWTGNKSDATTLFSSDPEAVMDSESWANLEQFSFIQRMQIALTLASESQINAFDLRPKPVARTGARILRLQTQALTMAHGLRGDIAQHLAAHWDTQEVHLLNATLILCADHELNASSFTARVVASAEANPYAVVLAGLSALQGFKHGGHTRRVTAFLREVEQIGNARAVIEDRLLRGEALPGFGHVLYPAGDPRARLLLSMLRDARPDDTMLTNLQTVIDEVAHVTGESPTVDFALVALERVLALPQGTALALFALGRTAGWIGHAMEQYASGQLIRPRAQYVGLRPQSDG